jgi:hypothetical protein
MVQMYRAECGTRDAPEARYSNTRSRTSIGLSTDSSCSTSDETTVGGMRRS